MTLPKMAVCWILLIFGTTNGEELVEFDVTETRIFSATLECRPLYQSNDNIECKFYLKNNDHQDYSVLKLHTPLEGQPSDCLKVTRNGKKLEYDGIFVKRSLPGPDDFLLVAAGKTVSSTFDVSAGYDMSESGTYTVAVDTYLEYVKGSVKGMNVPGKPAIQQTTKISHFSSPVVAFNVTENLSRKTLGQKARSLENNVRFPSNHFSSGSTQEDGHLGKRGQVWNIPRDPNLVGGSAAQRAETIEVHRAAYHYVKAAISDLNSSPERVKTWFGKPSAKVVRVFKAIQESLEKDVITYNINNRYCQYNWHAYTYKNSYRIYLCPLYQRRRIFSGPYLKLGIVVHELAHARGNVNDEAYGWRACTNLARNSPDVAINNADNYEYFVQTLYPFNHGIDAITTLSDGYTYMFKGNFFVKFKEGSTSFRYPVLLKERFGSLPGMFARGFDSFVCHKAYGKAYATNGDQYIRFTDTSAKKLSPGYPKPIFQNWDLSPIFGLGFDSMVQLPNGVTYATKDEQYVRYSDKKHLFKVDSGYPKELKSGAWDRLPENFRSGFDAMCVFPSGKVYVFKGTKYIRYTHFSWNLIDSGYPKPIKGNWGNVPQEEKFWVI